MKNFLSPLIVLSIASLVSTLGVEDQAHCCGNKSISLKKYSFSDCENGQKSMLSCLQGIAKVTHDFDLIIYEEDDGGLYMTAYTRTKNYAFEVRAPYYCVANQTVDGGKHRLSVLYCIDRIISMKQDSFDYEYWKNLVILILSLLFLLSGLLLAITAVIYFILPQTQSIEEKCTFHLTLNQSFFCLLIVVDILVKMNLFETSLLDEHCAIHWYLYEFTVIGFFTWSALLAYHMWSRFGQNSRINDSSVMRRYLLVGYGIPALLVALSNIHIHWNSFSQTNDFYGGCYKHSSSGYTLIYAGLPIIVIQSACVYFFVSLHRKLWNEQPGNLPQYSASNLNKYKFRLVLNAKLLLLTELPFVLIIFCVLFLTMTRSVVFLYIISGIICFISVEGIIVFFMLVIRRKRVLRGLADKFGLSMTGWQPCPEEEPIEYGNENENEMNREL